MTGTRKTWTGRSPRARPALVLRHLHAGDSTPARPCVRDPAVVAAADPVTVARPGIRTGTCDVSPARPRGLSSEIRQPEEPDVPQQPRGAQRTSALGQGRGRARPGVPGHRQQRAQPARPGQRRHPGARRAGDGRPRVRAQRLRPSAPDGPQQHLRLRHARRDQPVLHRRRPRHRAGRGEGRPVAVPLQQRRARRPARAPTSPTSSSSVSTASSSLRSTRRRPSSPASSPRARRSWSSTAPRPTAPCAR